MLDITPNRDEALRYMGYKGGAFPNERTLAILEQCEGELLSAAAPRFLYRIFPLEERSLIGCDFPLIGRNIVKLLENCKLAVLFCAGLGLGVDRLIAAAQLEDMAKAVILDALASAAVEALCNSVEAVICAEVSEKHGCRHHTMRFSPGYGDFPLEVQKDLLGVLNAGKGMGLFANESSCLTPTKSVTAIIGFSEKSLDSGGQKCETCNLRESCNYKKEGEFCGI